MSETAVSVNDRDSLIDEYRDFARQVVGKMINTMGLPGGLFDEFLAAGYLGLVEAAERFDPDYGKDFKSYAYLRIRGSIIDSIRRCSELSGRAYKIAKKLLELNEIRELEGTAESKHAQFTALFDFTSKAALSIRMDIAESELFEACDEPVDGPDLKIEQRQTIELLKKIVTELPDKEREILNAYYFEGKSFAEIADSEQHLSRSWISRLHVRGIELLKKRYFEQLEREML